MWQSLCPTTAVHSIRSLGSGTDHHAYLVNDTHVLRCPAPDRRPDLERERGILRVAAARSPLPVPEIVASDPITGASVHRLIPGRPLLALLRDGAVCSERVTDQLAAFVNVVHSISLDEIGDLVEQEYDDMGERVDEARAALALVSSRLDERQVSRLRAFLDAPPPSPTAALCFCHNDLGAEHIIVNSAATEVCGIIDWSDAAFADPAHDLARLRRDLPTSAFERIAATYGPMDEHLSQRVEFHARCFVVEDLAFGVETGAAMYADHAVARFDALFG